ncbi:MAG: putative metal-binding motif-containing protein, partial [Myxococcaceae bacterium]
MIRPSPMVLRSFVVALALAALTGCPRKTEGGLVLKVTIEPGVRGDCLIVDATSSGTRASRSTLTRQAMKGEYFIGISRGDFAASLDWQASVYQSCTGDEADWKLSARSTSKAQAFPTTGVEQFELVVGQPDATLDADRDTWVDTAKGGADCNDADAQVNPGARQACASTIDTNCNGKLFCDDSTCSNEPACTTTATGLSFTTTLPTLVASDCSGAVTVQSVANGRPAAVASDVTVTLAPTGTPSAGLELFSDSACMTRLTSSTLPLRFGTNQVTFSFRTRTPGALTLTASAPGLGFTSLNTAITDRPVVSLGVSPASVSSRAGACSTAIDVTALDDRMMPTNVRPTDLALAIGYLPAGTNTVDVFSDPTCMMSGVPSIRAGASSTTLYLKGTRVTPAGMPIQVQLSSPTLGAPTSLDFVVTAGDPHHLEFTTQVLGTRNNECSRAPAELRLYDANSNLTTAGASGVDVSLEGTPPSGGGTLEFFTAAGCVGAATTTAQIPAGQSSVLVYLRPSGPGTYGVTARTSLTVPTASLQVDVSTMDPTALYFPSAAVTLATTAGTCSPAVRLQTRELNAPTAPVSPLPMATTVTIAPSVAVGVAFFSDANCMMALTNNQLVMGAGSSEVSFYFRANRASSLTLSASATNFITTSPVQPVRIGPAPTSKLVFDTPAVVSAVAGQCSGGLVLRSFDNFDNPTSASGAVTPAAAPVVTAPDGVVFSSAPTCASPSATVTMTDGGVTFYASARRAQQYTITATGFSAQSTDAGVFTVDAGGPTVFAVVSQPMATVSASECTPITLERRDGFGNPSPVGAQSFSVAVNTTGVLSVHGDSASCTAGSAGPALSFAAGQTRATFYARGRLVGMSTLTATATGVTMSATTNAVNVIAAAATTLRFATGTPPASSAVGGCLQATLERLDTEGNLTGLPADSSVNVGATGAGNGNGLVLTAGSMCGATAQTSLSVTFTGAASSTTFSYSPRAPGALTFTATGTGLTSAVATTTVAAGAVNRVAFVSPPTADQLYDGCVPLQLEALDVGGNRVPSDELVTLSTAVLSTGTFFANATCTGGTMNTVTVVGMGVGSFWFKPLPAVLGMVTVHATPSVGVSGRASVSLNIVAGAETKLTRNDFPATNTAGDCVNFTVTRLDSGDHPTGGALRTVVVTATGAASVAPNEAQLHTGMGCQGAGATGTLNVDIAMGASTASFSVRLRKVGAITIATASNPLSAPANTTTSVGVGPLANITFATSAPVSLAINTCSGAVTVNGDDGFGNAAALGTQALSMTNGTFSSLAGCGDSIAQLTAGTATSATFYLRNSTAGMVSLTVGSMPSATQTWNFTGLPATKLGVSGLAGSVGRFACVGPLSVQALDAADGQAALDSARTVGLSATGTTFFASDGACTTALPSSQVTIPAMSSVSQDFYLVVVAPASGQVVVTATDQTGTGPLTAGTATATVTGTSGTLALTATPDVEFFDCDLVTVERRTNGGLPFIFGTTPVTVSLTSGTGLTLHAFADTNCTSGTATTQSFNINPLSATAQFRVRGRSAAPSNSTTPAVATLTATDTNTLFADGTVNLNVLPLVRRGSCSIPDGQASVSCPLGIDIPTDRNRTFMVFQAVGAGETAPNANVRCALNSTSAIACDRAGTGGDIAIEWQTATWGRGVGSGGVSVQHFTGTVANASNQVNQAFSLGSGARANSFMLFSHSTGGAANEN